MDSRIPPNALVKQNYSFGQGRLPAQSPLTFYDEDSSDGSSSSSLETAGSFKTQVMTKQEKADFIDFKSKLQNDLEIAVDLAGRRDAAIARAEEAKTKSRELQEKYDQLQLEEDMHKANADKHQENADMHKAKAAQHHNNVDKHNQNAAEHHDNAVAAHDRIEEREKSKAVKKTQLEELREQEELLAKKVAAMKAKKVAKEKLTADPTAEKK